MKHIKPILIAAVVLLAAVVLYVLFIRSPGDNGNYPPVPDTPAPAPHKGVFVSDHGSMEFNGDDTSVVIDFDAELAEMSGLPEGRAEGTYVFLSGDLPPHGSIDIRYDAAHEIRITIGESTAVIDLGIVAEGGTMQKSLQMVTPESIPIVVFKDDKPVGIVFELQK